LLTFDAHRLEVLSTVALAFRSQMLFGLYSIAYLPTNYPPTRCFSIPKAFQWDMPRDPYIRDKFTREIKTARQVARESFERLPKDRYDTVVESWADLQRRIEFVLKRKRPRESKESRESRE
jgi:hypothetical protein